MSGNVNIEGEMVEEIRQTLDSSVAQLDGRTAERLRLARLAALEAAAKPRWFGFPRWAAAGAISAFAVLILALSLWFAIPGQNMQVAQVEDVDILTAHEHLEVYENMDFYRWLADDQSDR
ncbi:MAG TPA: hypothetical protein VF799_10150 [Geobacteraceae bacterium]